MIHTAYRNVNTVSSKQIEMFFIVTHVNHSHHHSSVTSPASRYENNNNIDIAIQWFSMYSSRAAWDR